MKNVLILLSAILLFSFQTKAQIIVNDSAVLEPGYAKMVFYSLATGQKLSTPANDWHIAVTMQPTQFPDNPLGGTTIRINEAYGTKCYYVPNADATQFNTVDTSGYQTWSPLHDSDTKIDDGALNSTRSANIFDFGWGTYNSTTHNVTGDSLFLLELPDGSVKKILVTDLDRDTAFNIKIANIDNSDLQNLHISKIAHPNKFFVYVDLINNVVHDKEPLKTDWDLLFLRYTASDAAGPGQFYTTTGVWQKPGIQTAEARATDVNNNDYSAYTFVPQLNTIGWDWKTFNQGTNSYDIEDSLAYFVQTTGSTYKIIFTGFGAAASGVIRFYKEDVTMAGINGMAENSSLQVYPNPAVNTIFVSDVASRFASLQVLNLAGQIMFSAPVIDSSMQLDVSNLVPGMYVVKLVNDKTVITKQFIVQR